MAQGLASSACYLFCSPEPGWCAGLMYWSCMTLPVCQPAYTLGFSKKSKAYGVFQQCFKHNNKIFLPFLGPNTLNRRPSHTCQPVFT